MITNIDSITIDDVSKAARENSDKYQDRAKKIAEWAFIEGVIWAQKTYNITLPC